MLIRVEHATSYDYSEPLLATTQYLRMTPLSGGTQAVESWALTCPGASMTQWQDQYGNVCHTLTLPKPVEHLDIKVSGLVRTRDTNGVVGTASAELPSMLYLRDTPFTVVSDPIRDFAGRYSPEPKEDLIQTLHAIMLAVADEVAYRPGDTDVQTTGTEALEQGSGVCQDQAHVFCAVCRALGVPARYVSGYLSHGFGIEAHAASHAWAEAFVDSLGWVGFDPTNRVSPNESYIRTAVGLDYAEASPVRGVRAGGGVETMTVKVSFPSQQQTQ